MTDKLDLEEMERPTRRVWSDWHWNHGTSRGRPIDPNEIDQALDFAVFWSDRLTARIRELEKERDDLRAVMREAIVEISSGRCCEAKERCLVAIKLTFALRASEGEK